MPKHADVPSEPTPDMSEVPDDDAGAPAAQPLTPPRGSHRVAVIALAVALLATALAAWSVLRPAEASTATTPPATDKQTADAKARVCDAFTTVTTAVSLQTHADVGPDPVAVEAVAANARLALATGGTYLLAHLDPATPTALATATRTFADNLQEIAMHQLAGVANDDPAQAARLKDGTGSAGQIADLCK